MMVNLVLEYLHYLFFRFRGFWLLDSFFLFASRVLHEFIMRLVEVHIVGYLK